MMELYVNYVNIIAKSDQQVVQVSSSSSWIAAITYSIQDDYPHLKNHAPSNLMVLSRVNPFQQCSNPLLVDDSRVWNYPNDTTDDHHPLWESVSTFGSIIRTDGPWVLNTAHSLMASSPFFLTVTSAISPSNLMVLWCSMGGFLK